MRVVVYIIDRRTSKSSYDCSPRRLIIILVARRFITTFVTHMKPVMMPGQNKQETCKQSFRNNKGIREVRQ